MSQPYSYHTFILPFIFDDEAKVTREHFIETLDRSVWQESQHAAQKENIFKNCDIRSKEDARLRYNEYVYFNRHARDAIYGTGANAGSVVRNFSFRPDIIRCGETGNASTARYYIEKTISKEIDDITLTMRYQYRLSLNGIKLKLFNTGVGIMIFETEYHGEKMIEYRCSGGKALSEEEQKKLFADDLISDIKRINEWGRRIAPPCLFGADNISNMCADMIGIELPGELMKLLEPKFGENCGQVLITDLKKTFDYTPGNDPEQCPAADIQEKTCEAENDSGDKKDEPSPETVPEQFLNGGIKIDYIADFICRLMTFSKTDCSIVVERAEGLSPIRSFYIQPATDDRMYVSCLIRSNSLCNKLRQQHWSEDERLLWKALDDKKDRSAEEDREYCRLKEKSFAYKEDVHTAEELYALIAVDLENASCQNYSMTDQLLEKFLYTRWRNFGTYHAVTHHSMFCITGENGDVVYSVINPFLMHYQQMLCLVIAQRSSIISLCDRVAVLSGTERVGRGEKIRKLVKLQEDYIAFQNQLLFFEVTPQEQGIEMYQLMQKSLYIEDEKREIEDQLQNLYEATTVKQDQRLNNAGLVVAVVALVLTLVQMFVSEVDWSKSNLIEAITEYISNSGWTYITALAVTAVICALSGLLTWGIRTGCFKKVGVMIWNAAKLFASKLLLWWHKKVLPIKTK